MKNEVYCSTGTVIGRKTGFDHSVIKTLLPSVCRSAGADGIEHVFIPAYYEKLDDVRRTVEASGLRCAVLHAEKNIGAMLSGTDKRDIDEAFRLWCINCDEAKKLGADRVVFHLWGMPDSDRFFDRNLAQLPRLIEIADERGLDVMIENIPCLASDPVTHWQELEDFDCRFTYDVRFGQLHGQNGSIPTSSYIKSGRISHIHISDFGGDALDFSAIRPILHPCEGRVDFPSVFDGLKKSGYSGTFTLESPVMYDAGLDIDKLTSTLSWLCREVGGLSK